MITIIYRIYCSTKVPRGTNALSATKLASRQHKKLVLCWRYTKLEPKPQKNVWGNDRSEIIRHQ